MQQGQDVERAWRYFQFNWIPIALMAVALSIGLMLANFRIAPLGALVTGTFVAVYAGFAYANARSLTRRDPQVMFCLGSTAQLVLITGLITPLTYVAGAANFPLQDANLLAIDRALGFDWVAYANFVNDRPILAAWLTFGYTMIRWPIFLIPALLAGAYLFQRIQEFIFAFSVALIITTVGSVFVPAIGVFQHIGLDPATLTNVDSRAYLDFLRDFVPVREQSMRTLDLLNLAGIVYFPSFHAGSAILYAWAFWPIRWMRPIALVANGAMIVATPVNGAHYLIDIVAGIAVAILAIVAAKAVGRWLATRGAAMQPKETLAVT
jgi:hypothetical protein